eukprot:13517522-Heterocapsa_arctica.AAC.1
MLSASTRARLRIRTLLHPHRTHAYTHTHIVAEAWTTCSDAGRSVRRECASGGGKIGRPGGEGREAWR